MLIGSAWFSFFAHYCRSCECLYSLKLIRDKAASVKSTNIYQCDGASLWGREGVLMFDVCANYPLRSDIDNTITCSVRRASLRMFLRRAWRKKWSVNILWSLKITCLLWSNKLQYRTDSLWSWHSFCSSLVTRDQHVQHVSDDNRPPATD